MESPLSSEQGSQGSGISITRALVINAGSQVPPTPAAAEAQLRHVLKGGLAWDSGNGTLCACWAQAEGQAVCGGVSPEPARHRPAERRQASSLTWSVSLLIHQMGAGLALLASWASVQIQGGGTYTQSTASRRAGTSWVLSNYLLLLFVITWPNQSPTDSQSSEGLGEHSISWFFPNSAQVMLGPVLQDVLLDPQNVLSCY